MLFFVSFLSAPCIVILFMQKPTNLNFKELFSFSLTNLQILIYFSAEKIMVNYLGNPLISNTRTSNLEKFNLESRWGYKVCRCVGVGVEGVVGVGCWGFGYGYGA